MTRLRIYKGFYGDERPTKRQLDIMRKLGIKQEIVDNCDRFTAFILIKKNVERYAEAKLRCFRESHQMKW